MSKETKSHPGALALRTGSVVGFIDAKIRFFSELTNLFKGNLHINLHIKHKAELFISESYSLDFFSAEDLFLGNLGIKEFFLGGIFISTDLGDYRIF